MPTIAHSVRITGQAQKLNIYAGAIGGSVLLKNTSDMTIWIGDRSVAPDNGYPVYPADAITIPVGQDLGNPVDIWAIRRPDELVLPGVGEVFSSKFDLEAFLTIISRV